nr:hypothetical protein [Tanacetum cinerariifolium]
GPHSHLQPPQRLGLRGPGAGKNGHSTQNRPALAALPDGVTSVAADRHGHDRPGTFRAPQRPAFRVPAGQRCPHRGDAPVLARKHRSGSG